MEAKVLENVAESAFNIGRLKEEVSKAKGLVDDAIDNGKDMVQRSVVATEERIEDTTDYIKQHPWQSVGTALGVGAAVGILAGWMTTRICMRSTQN